ncbi:VCBS repeat-containing protein [Microbacterium sp. X-17]|uniref:FG-GAP repeat domain-containing protein n=1 Tax=Microbacterium sp. X-17 TaxID=3144404 RepID=UPI0031F51BBB
MKRRTIVAMTAAVLVTAGGAFATSAQAAGPRPADVAVSGTATAALDCPLRYLTPAGEGSTGVRLQADVQGLVPGQAYTVSIVNSTDVLGATGSASAAADGSLHYQATVQPSALTTTGSYTWSVKATGQTTAVVGGTIPTTNPCTPIVKAPKRAALFHDSDITGDGYGDLLAMDLNGRLLLYANGIRSNPGGVPFSSGRVIGTGWGYGWGMRLVAMGDLSGDGVAEVVALRSDGTLVAYYNNIGSSPAGLPFSSATLIGSGWQSFTSFSLGDVDGDGYADIVADRSDGTRWFYKNRFASDPLHRPFSTGVRIPTDGMTTDASGNGVGLADFNGDGYADLTPADASVDLNRLPAGNANAFPAPVRFDAPTLVSAQLGEWSVGDYEGRGSSGFVMANTRSDGQLIYVKEPLSANWQSRVIGSGWTWGMTLIQ